MIVAGYVDRNFKGETGVQKLSFAEHLMWLLRKLKQVKKVQLVSTQQWVTKAAILTFWKIVLEIPDTVV